MALITSGCAGEWRTHESVDELPGATEMRWCQLPGLATIDVDYTLNPYDGDAAADKLANLKEQGKSVAAIVLPVISRWAQQVPDFIQVHSASRHSLRLETLRLEFCSNCMAAADIPAMSSCNVFLKCSAGRGRPILLPGGGHRGRQHRARPSDLPPPPAGGALRGHPDRRPVHHHNTNYPPTRWP